MSVKHKKKNKIKTLTKNKLSIKIIQKMSCICAKTFVFFDDIHTKLLIENHFDELHLYGTKTVNYIFTENEKEKNIAVMKLGTRRPFKYALRAADLLSILDKADNYTNMMKDKAKISDGYHTFEELYYQRMILFSVICNTYKHAAWKSKLHFDGKMFEGYFIVGVTTDEGQFTYHYKLEYWDCFDVIELKTAPEWDGHTGKDVLRLNSLLKEKTYVFGIDLGKIY